MKTKFKLDFKLTVRVLVLFLLVAPAGLHSLSAGSLWREAVTEERGMFADKRARRIGDIVTVIMDETITLGMGATAEFDRKVDGQPGLGTNLLNQFVAGITSRDTARRLSSGTIGNYDPRFPTNLLPRESGVPQIFDPNKTGDGSVNVSTNKINTSQNYKSQLTVQIIDVLPNGNLVVEGMKQVSLGKDRMYAALRGILRPYDITAQNTIPSTLVADMRLDYLPEGDLVTTQRRGWLHKIDEKISPW